MVRTFARLKLRLLRNSFRLGWQQKIGLVLGIIYAVPLALGGFVALASLRAEPDLARSVIVVAFVALFAGWLVGPLLGFGSDETLDPARVALLPLPRRRLAAGLLAASSVGIGGAGTAVVLAGAVVGLAPAGPGGVLVVAAAAVQFVLCIVGARTLTTALSGVLRSRRGRDVLVLVAVVLAVGLPQIFNLLTRRGVDALEAVAGVVAWTPPALAAQAALEARAGDLVAALLALAGAVATIGLLAWLWMASLDRSLTTASVSSTGSSRRAAPGLFPTGWAWLPRDRRGAVAAKELRYYGRDPRARAGTLIVVIFALALPIVVAISGWGRQPESVLAVGVLAAWVGLGAINQYGIEAGAYWMNVVSGVDVEDHLVGKNLGFALWTLAVVTPLALALAVVTGGWLWVLPAVLISAGVLGVALGVGNVVSARAPQPMPASSSNLFAANSGQGCTAGLLQLLAITAQAVLLAPVVLGVGAALAWWPPGIVVVAALSVLWGYGCWRFGLAQAVRWLAPRQPELLDALSPRHAG
ncbi:MAG: hypothetical protein M3535_06170 [Actinomycetota bacterium]|nr:hypothetical protein [Actinomycetota bacterium]